MVDIKPIVHWDMDVIALFCRVELHGSSEGEM